MFERLKKYITVKNVIYVLVALIALIIFFSMFGESISLFSTCGTAPYFAINLDNVVTGSKFIALKASMDASEAAYLTEINPSIIKNTYYVTTIYYEFKGLVLPIIGYILVLLSAIGLIVNNYVIKEFKYRKILNFVLAGLIFLGGIFIITTESFALEEITNFLINSSESYNAEYLQFENIKMSGCVGSLVFAIICSLLIVGAEFIPNYNLVELISKIFIKLKK